MLGRHVVQALSMGGGLFGFESALGTRPTGVITSLQVDSMLSRREKSGEHEVRKRS